MKKILVIGSSNVDIVVDVPHTPKVGETVLAKKTLKFPGGKGANQAFACGKLGGDVSFLSTIGDDEAGELLMSSLRTACVNLDGVAKIGGENTGTALIYVNAEGDNCIVVITGANNRCDVPYVQSQDSMLENSDIIMIKAEIPLDSVFYSIKRASEYGKTIIFNPAPAPEKIPDDILSSVDYLTPNESELEKLTGLSTGNDDDIKAACKLLLKKGVKNVIVTLGARGAMLCNGDLITICPGYPAKAVDTTAAGDTFNGAFAVALAKGCEITDAIEFANKAAGISVSRKGAQTSIPSVHEMSLIKTLPFPEQENVYHTQISCCTPV